MASPLTPATYIAANPLTAAQMNAIRDNMTAVQNPATVQCYQLTTGQSIPANTITAILFNTNGYDPYTMHSTTVNTSRLTVPTGWAGKYRVSAAITWPAPASAPAGLSYFQVGIYKNATPWSPYARDAFINVSGVQGVSRLTWESTAVVGDYFEVYVNQNASSLPATLIPGTIGCVFTATWVSL